MNELLRLFQDLNFSQLEANVYLTLVKYQSMNGSQIAKITGLARSSVYTALESLYQKEAAIFLTGEPRVYQPKPPDVLLDEVKNKCMTSADLLKEKLSKWQNNTSQKEYWNIKGMGNLLFKITEMLKKAQKEILINTDFLLKHILEDLEKCDKRKVRIIHFSFIKPEKNYPFIETYYNSHGTKSICNERVMLVIDHQEAVVAGGDINGKIIGTYTQNPLFVSIITEHIHHDIYLRKLENKLNQDLIDQEIQIGSLMEDLYKQNGK